MGFIHIFYLTLTVLIRKLKKVTSQKLARDLGFLTEPNV